MSIYMDNAATTPVDPDVYRAMQPFFMDVYGNPSSIHAAGREARGAVETARKQCAKALNCEPQQIFFTSGATESNQWALDMINEYFELSTMSDYAGWEHKYVCTSDIEHKSILSNIWRFNQVKPTLHPNGVINWKSTTTYLNTIHMIKAAVIGWVNNEIGVLQPMDEISEYCYEHKMPLHVDATQAVGKLFIDLKKLRGVTSLAISAHKIGGLKGVGLLYIRDLDAEYVHPMIRGGGQEHKLRAGTENVPGIVGLGVAMEKISKSNFDNTHVSEMHKFLQCALSEIPAVRFNGNCEYQLPYYLNVSFKGIGGESLLLALDRRGICVSSGSACNSGSLEPSHVLSSIGVPDDYINGTIRISLSDNNTMEECITVAEAIKEEVAKLRSISPTWKGE